MEELSLRDMLAILYRQRRIFGISTAALLALMLIIAVNWTNYRSTATVQIEQSYVSTNLTNPNEVMETMADQRINQIQQKVTSLESLSQIITKFNLYPGEVDNTPIAILTAQMRKKIKVEFINGSLSNPAAAQKQTAEQLSAIAFDLSFDYQDPQATQQVADELVTRFLDEDLKMRRTQAQETSAFLATQITALEASMVQQEKAIAEFRAKNGESGPSALIFNQQTAANLTMSVQNIQTQLTSNEGTQGSLRAQLALVEPYSRVIADGQLLTTPAVQLKALETQYATLTGQYGPDHPDVIKLRSQIAALKTQIGPAQANAQLEAQLADVRTNLEAAKSTKGPDHPDVIALQKQFNKLQATLASKGVTPKPETLDEDGIAEIDDGIKPDADNPAYLQLAAQLKSAESQHRALVKQRDTLLAEQSKYEQNVAANPQIEQEMSKLTRDYENSQLRYRELKEKKMAADMNEQLEIGRKGQRLVVINPPAIPEDTHPKRIYLLLGGIILSVMGGLGCVTLAEAANQNIYGTEHLSYIIGIAPLVTIPHILSEQEKTPASRYRTYITAAMMLMALSRILAYRGVVVPYRIARKQYSILRAKYEARRNRGTPHG